MKKLALIFVFSLVLSGCLKTGYVESVPFFSPSGYSHSHLNENIYEVKFSSLDEDELLFGWQVVNLRAAELTLEEGKKFFVILDSETYMIRKIYSDSFGVRGIFEEPRSNLTMAIYGSKEEAEQAHKGADIYDAAKHAKKFREILDLTEE